MDRISLLHIRETKRRINTSVKLQLQYFCATEYRSYQGHNEVNALNQYHWSLQE